MNVGFWDNQLGERGTTTALYDYAYYNEKILKNRSFVFYDKNCPNNKQEIIEKFEKQFFVKGFDDFLETEEYIKKYNITHIYIEKEGRYDNRISKIAINCVHCVFHCLQPHGDIYASIGKTVVGNNGHFPVVPYMINLPEHDQNKRKKLNIPEEATVFGGYGGEHSFSMEYVHKTVYLFAKNNPHIYFVFANFVPFCHALQNIIHLPMITDLNEKVEFINTCDAMLWARTEGETFGLAIGEFSSKNKPVICSKSVRDNEHIEILKEKCILYHDETSLYNILANFRREEAKEKDWNAYRNYTPENVMQQFEDVFLR